MIFSHGPRLDYIMKTDLNNILKLLLSRFIKTEIMVGDISKLNIMDKDNSIGAKKINLGYMTRQALRLITATDKEILLFRVYCLVILQTICLKLMLKLFIIFLILMTDQ